MFCLSSSKVPIRGYTPYQTYHRINAPLLLLHSGGLQLFLLRLLLLWGRCRRVLGLGLGRRFERQLLLRGQGRSVRRAHARLRHKHRRGGENDVNHHQIHHESSQRPLAPAERIRPQSVESQGNHPSENLGQLDQDVGSEAYLREGGGW